MVPRFMRWLESRIPVFAPFDDTKMPPATFGRFVWTYVGQIKRWLFVIFISALLLAAIESSLLILVGRFVDLLNHADPATVLADHGWLLIGGAVLLLIVRPLVTVTNEGVVNAVAPQITNRIRWRTHLYTLGHSLSYFQGDFAGRVANRIVQAGPAVRDMAVELLDVVVYVVVYATIALATFSTISLWLALPLALWIAGYIVLMRYFVPEAQERSKANSDRRSALVGRIVDSYTNILTVKLFARADTERSAVKDAIADHTIVYIRSMRLFTVVKLWLVMMNTVLLIAVASLALWLWTRGVMTPGEVAAALGLTLRVSDMSNWFMQMLRNIFDNVGVVQESMETIAKPHGVVDAPDAVPLKVTDGAISFDQVVFRYGKESGVFDRLSLDVRPGERVGLVGPSGAGKSTLINLLLRLYDVEGGTIRIDGQDVAKVTQDSLREAIGLVTQDTSLLHRSIRDNIAYGRPGADDEAIERAARLARAADFIPGLQDHRGRRGYDSRVGERGVKLSGGQRQRIAIARVLLKNAPILVLDEATSALDSEVEAQIQRELELLMRGKTVLAIAHRLSTIMALDRLIVMDQGRIVEEGSHTQLVERGGLYARLWSRQSGGFLATSAADLAAE